jgi:adenylate cyclase
VFFISLLMGLILVPMRLQRPLSDPVCQAAFWDFLKDGSHIKAAIFWSFVVAITQMLLQANSKFGHGNFWNMVRGRYNTPKEEQKIFMFLDLNASTTIAERLGDEKYHAFLKDFFADITLPILENRGSIFQ